MRRAASVRRSTLQHRGPLRRGWRCSSRRSRSRRPTCAPCRASRRGAVAQPHPAAAPDRGPHSAWPRPTPGCCRRCAGPAASRPSSGPRAGTARRRPRGSSTSVARTSACRSIPNVTVGPRCSFRKPKTRGVVGVQHGNAFPAQSLNQLPLLAGNLVDGLEVAQMCRTDVRHHADVRRGGLGQRLHLARVIDSDLDDGRAGLVRDPQERQRQAVLVVEVAFRPRHRQGFGQQRRRDLLRGRLSATAGDRDHGRPQSARARPATVRSAPAVSGTCSRVPLPSPRKDASTTAAAAPRLMTSPT